MNPTSLSLALRIAQLIEEHSETELQEAISLLERHDLSSELLDYNESWLKILRVSITSSSVFAS